MEYYFVLVYRYQCLGISSEFVLLYFIVLVCFKGFEFLFMYCFFNVEDRNRVIVKVIQDIDEVGSIILEYVVVMIFEYIFVERF